MTRVLGKAGAAIVAIAGTAVLLAAVSTHAAGRTSTTFPEPAVDVALVPHGGDTHAVLAGGCFWGLQLVFQHVRGVKHVTAGYAGGGANTATYEEVGSGTTGHAESVDITYDPSQISYGQLLKVYFSVAHNPTELNRQGPDEGTQYRSAIFFSTPEQERVAKAYIAQLDSAKVWSAPIVTQVVALPGFYPAEDYHQNYATLHPNAMYILINDHPKLLNLQQEWPKLYR
jgi:peptide-methionine (S)-S-oxide reductase